MPEEDRYSHSRQHLESQLSSLFGGRIAEELIFGPEKVTTGASNDIERATQIARNMVTKWGLSADMGPLTYGEDEGEVFLGRQMTTKQDFSDETATKIDAEVRRLVDTNSARAEKILKENEDKLHLMAEALIKYETIDEDQIADIMSGKPARQPEGWDDSHSDGSSSDKPAEPTKEERIHKSASDDGGEFA